MSDDKPANAIPLAYGDIILISSPFNDNLTLFSDGIVKSQIYLKNFGSGTRKKSFYRSLFQIYPSFINTHKTQALALRESKGSSETQDKKEKLEELKEKLNFEYKFNLEHFEKVRNTPITYGNSIQFLHLASNKFLACHFTEAEVEKENYKLELVDIPSEASNFKISPSYKHQKENEGYIYYKDLVYVNFANNYLNKTPYLHCNYHLDQGTLIMKKTIDSERLSQGQDSPQKRRTSSNGRSSHSDGRGVSINQNLKSDDNVHNSERKAGKKEINVSLVKCRWKINLFSHESQDKSFLSYGDTIWMNHAEHNASMIARKEKNGEVDFVQTIVSDANQQYSGNTNGMWIIENQTQSSGGLVEWDDEFRLKHLSSGKYLSVDYSHLKKKHILKLDAEKNEDSLFKFELMPTLMIEQLPQHYKNINKEAFIRIRSAATKLWLHVEHIGDRLEGYLLPEVIDDDIFKLFKANNNEIWETNFLISCFPILQNYLVGLEETSGKVVIVDEQTAHQKIEKRAKEAQECLMQLELFCTNRLLNTSLDQKYGEVNPYRQKVLREQYFLETLGEILKYSFTEAHIENYLNERDTQEDLKNKKGFVLQKLVRKAKIQSGKGNDFFLMEQKISICRLIYRLFKSICKENKENELYAYHIIDQFQYHAKYLEEAVDCFISIINSNEGILSRIGEDVKVSEVLEHIIQPAGAAAGPKKKIKLFNLSLALGIKDPNDYESQNFITYFLKLIYDNATHKRNLSYLRFLKSICVCEEKGMTINQEHLYKIFAASQALDKATFMETVVDEDNIRIGVDDKNLVPLSDLFKLDTNPTLWKNEMSYFLEQVSFYSTLLEGRNYLWKMRLEKQFPAGVVFEQIYNEKLSLQIRSVFCDLALALYIDQEPLNPRIVPNLCRVFKKKNKGGASGSMTFSLTENTHKLAQIDKENFVKLLENIVKIVEDQKKKILEDLEGKCENISEAKFEQLKVDNYLNNIVLAKLVKLLCKMVSFDLFLLLDGKSNYYQIVHDLLHILEFDKNSPATSYALMKIRDENYKKNATENKLGMFNVIGDFAGIVGDFSKDLVGNLKNVAGAMFGAEKKKSRSEIVGIIEEGDDALYVSNPIMKGLILLKNQIDQLNVGVSIEANNTEIMIKGEICDLLNYMLDLRQDYLLSNILGWYEEVVPKITGKSASDVNSALEALIEREVGSIFPDISRTGLIEIDAKYRPKEENVVLDGLKTISKLLINLNSKKKKEPPKLTKFVNYTEEEEFPDLDTLFTGLKMTGKKEILPSLLTSFYMTNDTHLENKLLTLIMRMFGQREESIDNLQKLEMVFERDDVEAYYKLERWSEDLRLQTQRSEIWLSDFILTKGEKDWELKNVMKLFKDITNLVFSNVDGNEKNAKSRQNMMRNLDSYTPMIGMIRDGAFHLRNALDDPNLPAGPKQQLIELFSVAHACLICFCHNNPENQALLSSNMKLFLSNLNIEFGQITLVCEICKDNKDVCEASADLIITSLLDAITKYGHKASFLEPLTALQKHKTGFLVENHIKIMNRFITASRALEETELKALYASINPDTKEVELTFQKILPMDEPFIYHARLFDVLMFDSQGNDSLIFTHTRLRKVFTVPYCLRLVQQISIPDRLLSARGVDVNDINISLRGDKRRSSVMGYLPLNIQRKYSGNVNTTQSSDPHEEGFRLLKPKVIQILGTLYLKGDKLLAEEFLEHLDLFVDFIKSEKESIQNLSEEFRPSAEFSDYLFKKLLCFTKDYVEKLILSNTDEARDRRDSAAILELVDIVYSKFPSLGLKISKEDATNFRALVRHYIDESTVTNSQVPYMLDSILRSKDSQRTAPDEVVNDKNEPPQKRYVYFESKEAANYSIYWQDFLNATTNSKTVNESVKNERAALSEAIWKFEEVFPKEYKKKYKIEIESKDIIRKLVVFLRDGQKNKADQGTMIATLRVLKEIIESAPDMTEMQNFFDKQDATRMLLTVLSDPKLNSIEDDLLNEFLEFGIALLEGGNQNVQKTIYTFCTVYSMSQLMFAKFHSIIYGQIYYLQARAELKNDPVKSAELEQAHGLKSEILERLLRFLQLFTEGHFEDLQNYLRYQTNSRNRYNIVEAIIDLLNTYSQDLVQSNYENIIKCLDTLNEFVQGPCKENQIALVDGKFFDVVLTLFNKKIRSKAKHRRKSKPESAKKSAYLLAAFMADGGATPLQSKELEPWMLARLKYKVLILVNSLLERSSKSVIKRVMRSLPLEVLKKNLVKIFKKYKELYGNTFVMESLKHFEGDPNDKDDLKPPGYYEMIIESGFMIYFLICSYTDLDTQDIDDDLLNELNELKETNLFDVFMPDMLQNNVFGQLATFGYTFVKSLVDTGNELRASFEKRFRKTNKLEIKENEEEKRIRKSLENQQLNKEAMQFFGQNSTSIEVARLGEIERIQFMVLPYCRELPKDEKNAFNENVNRQNPKTKVEGLVEESDKLIDMCKHELKLKLFFNRRKFIAIFTNFVNLWKDLAFFLSIILNALILTSYSAYFGDPGDVDNGRMSDPELFLLDSVSTESTIDIFVGIGIAMTICSIFVVFFFFLKRVPLILKKALDEKSIIKKIFKIVFYSLQSVDTVYYLAYGAFALFGLFIHPFFFAMHLTEILFRYPTLKNVIKSIWIPRKQLALTFLLFLVLTYFFSIYAYAYMDDIYNGNCESTLLCFKTTFDGTFKANGGIGGYNPPETQGTFNTERFIFDNLANIILLIIMINIVAGIIIDTFGLLREQEEEKNADIQEKCFICGLDKDVFDRQADSSYNFNVHIKREHNMWAYIFFLAFLKEKDETEYTGIESYISDKVKNQELNWFPFSRALSLKHHDEQESENTKEALEYFNAETDEIKKSMKNLNEAYSTLTSRMNIN